jgi:hypothetical protein
LAGITSFGDCSVAFGCARQAAPTGFRCPETQHEGFGTTTKSHAPTHGGLRRFAVHSRSLYGFIANRFKKLHCFQNRFYLIADNIWGIGLGYYYKADLVAVNCYF